MKLNKGVTVYIGNKKFVKEIPDNLVSDGLKKKLNKSSPDEQAPKKAVKKDVVGDGN